MAAAYAATEMPALPEEPMTTPRYPEARACAVTNAEKRSLCEPVGFAASFFTHTFGSRSTGSSGVCPWPRRGTSA